MSTQTSLEPVYALDTHALIWYLLDDPKLGQQARVVFAAAEQNQVLLLVSAVVMAELYFANAKNKWFADFGALFADIVSKPFIRFVAFEHIHVANFSDDTTVPEMHDRIIAGMARRLGVPLLTSDPFIVRSSIVRIIW
jgi:PIN domain nuclease of toxin-antitoxin system